MGSQLVGYAHFDHLEVKEANSHQGFHATTSTEYAEAFEKALSLPDPLAVRQRARISAKRFTEEAFAKSWITQMEKLVDMRA